MPNGIIHFSKRQLFKDLEPDLLSSCPKPTWSYENKTPAYSLNKKTVVMEDGTS